MKKKTINKLTRREMIYKTSLIAGGVCLCNLAIGKKEKKSTCCFTPKLEKESYIITEDHIIIDLLKAKTLKLAGHAAEIVNNNKKIQIIIVKLSQTEYAALNRLCTHGGQVISYNNKREVLQCNNSNHSIFDLSGNVIKGPAPKALRKYDTILEKNTLVVML